MEDLGEIQKQLLKLTRQISKRRQDIDNIVQDPEDLNCEDEQKMILRNCKTIITKAELIMKAIDSHFLKEPITDPDDSISEFYFRDLCELPGSHNPASEVPGMDKNNLNLNFKKGSGDEVRRLKAEIREKDATIVTLTKNLEQKDATIKSLNTKIRKQKAEFQVMVRDSKTAETDAIRAKKVIQHLEEELQDLQTQARPLMKLMVPEEFAKTHVDLKTWKPVNKMGKLHPNIQKILKKLGPLRYKNHPDHVDLAMPIVGPHQNIDGPFYEGQWLNGKWHGRGIYIWGDGSGYYEGEFEEDKYHGFGRRITQNGVVKQGEWLNDVFKGPIRKM